MKNTSYKFFVIVLGFIFTSCSNHYYEKGNKAYRNLQYYKAIKYYSKVVNDKKSKNIKAAKIGLANSYRMLNDVANAEKYFEEIVTYPECSAINKYYYGKLLMEAQKYKEARMMLTEYIVAVPGDEAAMMLLNSCYSKSEAIIDTTLYTLKMIDFPEMESTFGEVPYRNGLVFAANKKTGNESKKDGWTGNSFYDLYYSQKDKTGTWSTPEPLKGIINGRFHEGAATFSQDGNTIFFTRSNYRKYELQKNSKNENNLQIFKAQLIGDEWKNLEELPFNNDNYSTGQPCLSEDEKTMYFVSNMPEGFGGADIYKSVYDGTKWGTPENLGVTINTNGNEMFPFIAKGNVLYFSSDAHKSKGGLDIFVSTYDEKTNTWSPVENLSYPINSTKDDFGFVLNKDGKSGFVTSSRTGFDKIYEFSKHEPTYKLVGSLKSKTTGAPIEGGSITLFDERSHRINVVSDKNGEYELKIKPNTEYVVYCSKDGFFTQVGSVLMDGGSISKESKLDFALDPIVIDKPIVIEKIYYDLNKWEIKPEVAKELDQLARMLIQNSTINIEIGSHTDSRENDNYNQILSEKRAKAVVDYLIKKGIDPNRLSYKGYGEKRLVNRCSNGVSCTEVEHQQNRRTEFKVTKVNKL